MSVTAVSRAIDCDGAFNLRDLGGYRSSDGRTVKWRTVFRGDGMHRITDTRRVAIDLRLRTVIDLRTVAEVSGGQYRCDGVDVVHLPLLRDTWDAASLIAETADAADFLVRRYIEMTEIGASAIAAAFELLASERRLPVVFHCSAGKDRTGLLAALLLAALGVDDHQIAQDYNLSASAMDRLVAWTTAHRPEVAEHMARQPSPFLACPPDAIVAVLQHLRAQHGAIHLYLADIGVDRETTERLRDHLLEDS